MVALEEMILEQRPKSDKEGCDMDVVERAIRATTKSPRQLVWLELGEQGGRKVNNQGRMGPSGIGLVGLCKNFSFYFD